MLRDASDTLTSITFKPSVGWTQLQLLERIPSIKKIHLHARSPYDHIPRGSQYSPTSTFLAFKEITVTAIINPFAFRCILPLLCRALNLPIKPGQFTNVYEGPGPSHSCSHLFDLIALLGTRPEEETLDEILCVAGRYVRKIHIERFRPTTQMITHCQGGVLEEIVIGVDPPKKPSNSRIFTSPYLYPHAPSGSLASSWAIPAPAPEANLPFTPLTSNTFDAHDDFDDPSPLVPNLQRRTCPPTSILSSIPSTIQRIVIFGRQEHLLPLDVPGPNRLSDLIELLEGRGTATAAPEGRSEAFPTLKEFRVVVDDAPPPPEDPPARHPYLDRVEAVQSKQEEPTPPLPVFSHPDKEEEWLAACKRAGVSFIISYTKVRCLHLGLIISCGTLS